MTLTVQRERFVYSRMTTRRTEPEVFTFERIPAQTTAVRSYVPIRSKKRCTRVMFPAKVRMHLPPTEKNPAKRWLIILCLVVLWQIYSEDSCAETQPPSTESAVSKCESFPRPAEDRVLRLPDLSAESNLLSTQKTSCEDGHELLIPDATCFTSVQEPENSRILEQNAGKSYMVALLVYHRLGGDN